MFDKEQYWAQRNAEKAFRLEWYRWRSESKEMWGANFVNANPAMFTQRAFMSYLNAVNEAETKAEEAQLALEAPAAEIPELQKSAPSENSGVIITDL